METEPLIRRGQVYWLDDCEPLDDENVKRRPVVVILVSKASEFVLAVAVTTKNRDNEADAIKLPNQQENPRTTSGLPRASWAIPRWYLYVARQNLRESIGFITGQPLLKLTAAVIARVDADRKQSPPNLD